MRQLIFDSQLFSARQCNSNVSVLQQPTAAVFVVVNAIVAGFYSWA